MDAPPFGRLEYLYVGSDDVARDVAWYRDVLGASVVWDHEAFGTRVAAVRVGAGPLWLLAGHRPPRSVLPIWIVADLEATVHGLRQRGWRPTEGPVEVPDGPAYVFEDPGGNALAVLQPVRPHALEQDG